MTSYPNLSQQFLAQKARSLVEQTDGSIAVIADHDVHELDKVNPKKMMMRQKTAKPLAEGALTAPVLVEIAHKKGIEMPIAQAVGGILAGRINVGEAISGLLSRPLRAEI